MCSVQKGVLEIPQNLQEHICARVSFLIKLQAKREILAQVFSCEFCEIPKNTFLQNTSTRLLLFIVGIATIELISLMAIHLSKKYSISKCSYMKN